MYSIRGTKIQDVTEYIPLEGYNTRCYRTYIPLEKDIIQDVTEYIPLEGYITGCYRIYTTRWI